jgi:hypothetical protein
MDTRQTGKEYLLTMEAAWNDISVRCLGLILGFSHYLEEDFDGLRTIYEVDL